MTPSNRKVQLVLTMEAEVSGEWTDKQLVENAVCWIESMIARSESENQERMEFLRIGLIHLIQEQHCTR